METITSADGTRIAFETVGSGPPVVLVGGAFCDHTARVAGTPLAAELRATHTLVTFDRRGRGESTDTSPYAVAREIEDVAALVAVAGGSAFVYGHSSGAVLALEAALAGLPIRKLALYEPPLVLAEERAPMPPDLEQELARLVGAGRRGDAAALFLARAVGVPEPALAAMKSAPSWRGLEALSHTLPYEVRLTADAPGVLTRARALRTPTLLLDGDRSPPWMRAGVARLARTIPDARSKSLAGQAHAVDPAALAPSLREFFAD
ncbi:MAG TPA: alpha/beta hydrolase [Polyangia bacterium]|jgi:pimeloyl-ACP methyl ester carboxylesterase|nr:alpha/beta hydrolase [Polyangia bacterium]